MRVPDRLVGVPRGGPLRMFKNILTAEVIFFFFENVILSFGSTIGAQIVAYTRKRINGVV